MSAPNSLSRHINGLQATRLDAAVHETGDVQGSREDADAVANDLGRNEESVHKPEPLGSAHFRFGRRPVGRLRPPLSVPTSWYVVKKLFWPCLSFAWRGRRRYCMNQP